MGPARHWRLELNWDSSSLPKQPEEMLGKVDLVLTSMPASGGFTPASGGEVRQVRRCLARSVLSCPAVALAEIGLPLHWPSIAMVLFRCWKLIRQTLRCTRDSDAPHEASSCVCGHASRRLSPYSSQWPDLDGLLASDSELTSGSGQHPLHHQGYVRDTGRGKKSTQTRTQTHTHTHTHTHT